MPKASTALAIARKEEIINVCAELYKTMSFKEITVKEIGKATSFTRTSIYNYFQTKEEIFLSLLKREYELWSKSLTEIFEKNDSMSKTELASDIAHSLENRKNMLKLMSMNLYDIEENSRIEQLTEFKKSYGNSIADLRKCLDKFCVDMSEKKKDDFLFSFFPLVYGIYPYTFVTEKQKEAMTAANVKYIYMSIYEMAFTATKKLLGE